MLFIFKVTCLVAKWFELVLSRWREIFCWNNVCISDSIYNRVFAYFRPGICVISHTDLYDVHYHIYVINDKITWCLSLKQLNWWIQLPFFDNLHLWQKSSSQVSIRNSVLGKYSSEKSKAGSPSSWETRQIQDHFHHHLFGDKA